MRDMGRTALDVKKVICFRTVCRQPYHRTYVHESVAKSVKAERHLVFSTNLQFGQSHIRKLFLDKSVHSVAMQPTETVVPQINGTDERAGLVFCVLELE